MLTRLRVRGFKNLVDVDVRFGPFTCIAGPNGVGKSNLFDAIRFLSALADHTLLDAALSVRNEGGRASDIRGLFHQGNDFEANEMSLEAEMIVPWEGVDDLGQRVWATRTLLHYVLCLRRREDEGRGNHGGLEIVTEELTPIEQGQAHKHLLFPHAASWRKSTVRGAGPRRAFISTEGDGKGRIVRLRKDGVAGRPIDRPAADLPRTMLSAANASESRTALLARREMQSWRMLQLEPSALRMPDGFAAIPQLGTSGGNLPATLNRLAQQELAAEGRANGDPASTRVCARIANRLAELNVDVREVQVDRDEKRQLLTLLVKERGGPPLPAASLSDGTLRFLALAVILEDPDCQGVLCVEEPENGIHPARLPSMVDLLQDIGVDANDSVDADNPLRQVIVNTHSPALVQQAPDDSLVVAEAVPEIVEGKRCRGVRFEFLPGTWREVEGEGRLPLAKGRLLEYLEPVILDVPHEGPDQSFGAAEATGRRRVIDREDVRDLLQLPVPEETR